MKYSKIAETKSEVRIGEFKNDKITKMTPSFFVISNFGGGGTNVSRFISYFHLFSKKSDLLLNYFYLTKPDYSRDIIKELNQFDDIRDFIRYAQQHLIVKKKSCIKSLNYRPINWGSLILIDNGSGSIFRDLCSNLNETNFHSTYESVIDDYLYFCEKFKVDIAISFDIADKNTKKKGENKNVEYKLKLSKFIDMKWNLLLNELFLKKVPNDSDIMYYGAIHGNSPEEYLQYLNSVLSIEKKMEKKYSGFAIGDLGKYARSRPKIYRIIKSIRARLTELDDNRPIHILGVGAVQNIIPLSVNGADTFDCHSPWRRASEKKMIVPLLNSNFDIIANNKDYWKYVKINEIKANSCDCEVCNKYSISQLLQMTNGCKEEKYYAQMLFFKHNIHQQEILCELVKQDINLKDFVQKFPSSKYKNKMLTFFNSND